MDITAIKQQFDTDGFVHLKGFMSIPEVDDWAAKFDRFVAEIVPTLERRRAMHDDYDDPATLKQIDLVDRYDAQFDALLRDPRMIELAGALLEDDIVPDHIEAFIKAPFKGTPTPPHQDGYYFGLVPNEALTVWMPIGDIDESNGALCYIKGSNHHGILDHSASGILGFSQGLAVDFRDFGEEVVCAVNKGDCLVHHSRTIHYASGNPTPRPRRSLGLVYYAARAQEDKEFMASYHANVKAQQATLGVV